jgi:predicted TIM-barrel fold metal-dependent hydrolase
MLYRYPINDAHIHLFDPQEIDECRAMIDYCGFKHWNFLAVTVMDTPFALVQNLLGALLKLKENGRCCAFGTFHYDGGKVPDADEMLRQIEWLDKAGFDGVKMLDGKPGIRRRHALPLDAANYDKMFDYAQRTQMPIMYHINDPIEFWHRELLPQWAVEQKLFYDDGTYPHKFTIEEEALGILHKHPNLNICIPHFFFVSDQPGLCTEMLDRYPNLFFDITPGWEMFENFAKDREFWRHFFNTHSRKILFGSDTFSDHWKETVTCLQRVLETSETFVAFEENCTGLDLPEQTLRDIYYNNYHNYVRRTDKPLNVPMILDYADTLYERIPAGADPRQAAELIDWLKKEIARYR